MACRRAALERPPPLTPAGQAQGCRDAQEAALTRPALQRAQVIFGSGGAGSRALGPDGRALRPWPIQVLPPCD